MIDLIEPSSRSRFPSRAAFYARLFSIRSWGGSIAFICSDAWEPLASRHAHHRRR